MKNCLSEIKLFILGFLFSLSFFAVAVSADWRIDVNPTDVLTDVLWNDLKNAVLSLESEADDLDNSVTSINTNLTKSNVQIVDDSCYGNACSQESGNYVINLACPSDKPILMGGDCLYHSYASIGGGRNAKGEILSSDTYKCYCPSDGNSYCRIKIYCFDF